MNRNVKVYIQSYKQASAGAKALQANLLALNAGGGSISRVWRRASTDFPETVYSPAPIKNCLMINWGTASEDFDLLPHKPGYFILNDSGVRTCQNKLSFFKAYSGMDGLRLPTYWTNSERALGYIHTRNINGDPIIVERHNLTGHSGAGIRLVKEAEELRTAPLYVQYIPKKTEYRVHFFRHRGMETQFFVQQKRLKRTEGDHDHHEGTYKIRNHQNGWVFCHHEVDDNPHVIGQAKRFAEVTPLSFGAIDIIYNARSERAFILEVNTAPGIEGETGKWYAKNINLAASRHNFASNTKAYTVAV